MNRISIRNKSVQQNSSFVSNITDGNNVIVGIYSETDLGPFNDVDKFAISILFGPISRIAQWSFEKTLTSNYSKEVGKLLYDFLQSSYKITYIFCVPIYCPLFQSVAVEVWKCFPNDSIVYQLSIGSE